MSTSKFDVHLLYGKEFDTSDLYLYYFFLENKNQDGKKLRKFHFTRNNHQRSVSQLEDSFRRLGVSDTIPVEYDVKNYFSNIIRGLLKVVHVESGRISFLLCVKPVVTNIFGGLHGGAIASVTEMVALDCARTVVGKEKELFLGELSNSYLFSAPREAEVVVDASVVRSGRNLTVVAVEFKMKESDKLVYTSRATFYNMPVASL